MKKLSLAFLLLLLNVSLLSAQGLRLGLMAGSLEYKAQFDISLLGLFRIASIDPISESGYYLGVLADLPISKKLHIQPEVNYTKTDFFSFVYIPVVAKVYLTKGIHIQGVAQLNYSVEVGRIKNAIEDIAGIFPAGKEFTDAFNSVGIELGGGAGINLSKHLMVQARYTKEITDRYSGPLGTALDIRGRSLHVGLVLFL